MRRLRKLLRAIAAVAAGTGLLRAQNAGPLTPASPFVHSAPAPSPGSLAVTIGAAQRAHDLGLPLLAADLYRQARDMAGADRAALTIALATALLDAGQAAEAEKALAEVPDPRPSAWHLRAGLAAVQLRKLEAARAELAAIKEDELTAADYPWYWFFQGEIVDLAPVPEISRANDFYHRAEEAAPTPLAHARFQLAAEQLRLRIKEKVDPRTALESYRMNQGTQIGYYFAESHAIALDANGQKSQAVTFLQGVLIPLQRQEREWWDRFRLVLGLIDDRSRNGPGRNALTQLLENGNAPQRQRQALQLLAAASEGEAARKQFRALLDKLIAAKPDHPIKESVLFYRGQLALTEKDFLQAEEDANALLRQYARSPLRAHAYGVLMQSAWEQRRFRLAADFAQKTRAELATVTPANPTAATALVRATADLGIVVAEARFRAGQAFGDRTDFRQAADAYATVLRDRPAELAPEKVGALMFQRVLAEIKAGSGDAGKVLDDLARDPAFDLENRWQAEFHLARELQLQGDAGVKQAYARVNALLRDPPAGGSALKPELRVRMTWLQARLAFDNNEPEQAIRFVEALIATPYAIDPALRTEIASNAVLLKAQAQFALGREDDALRTLAQLREDFRKTDAAVSSFLIESEFYAAQDKIDQARNRLILLTDNPDYKTSEVVPYALYRLALLSERLGRDENLIEANRRIEDLMEIPAAHAQPDLIFTARMKQGDIYRKRNDFSAAQRVYEELVNKFPRRPDVVLAQLELAKTLNAQSTNDPALLDKAQLLFEQLRDRVDAPRAVRDEAGYNLGKIFERRGRLEEAARVWWADVVNPFLDEKAAAFSSDATRPYWLARTLRDLGDLAEKQGRTDEAKKAYQLILEKRLPGQAVAKARLEFFGVPVGQTP